MKLTSSWQKSATATVLASLATVALAAPSFAEIATPQSLTTASENMSLRNSGEFQLAQAAEEEAPRAVPAAALANCRRVSTNSGIGLNVRSSPNGPIVGSVANGTLVTIENRGTNGWVPISAPIRGYVSGAFLKLCSDSPPPDETPTDNCRRVSAVGGLRVRETASINGPVVGLVADGQQVTIVNRGANGWVPISAPVKGFVSAQFLKLCP